MLQRIAAGLLCAGLLAAQQSAWLQRAQADDGRWPAAAGGGRALRDLRATALMSLVILGDGSTLRRGPHRPRLKRAFAWLRAQQDDKGRIGLHTEPDWILDHAIAACVFAEAARSAPSAPLREDVRAALGYLDWHLRRLAPPMVTAELLLWTAHAARAAEPQAPDATAALRAQIERLRPRAIPVPERERAAALLLSHLAPGGPDRAALLEPFAVRGWPADIDDPLAVWYAGCALYRDGGRPWETFSRRISALIVRTEERAPEWRGTWAPAGAFGADGGRICTSAVHLLILQVYYRYCGLAAVAAD